MGTPLPFPKGAQLPPPNFRPCLLWPNGWMGWQTAGWINMPLGMPHAGDIVLDGDPARSFCSKGTQRCSRDATFSCSVVHRVAGAVRVCVKQQGSI